MLRAAFVLLALSCAAPLPSLAEPLRFAGDDGCPYLCPGTPQRPGYLVEALSQVLREPPHFDSLPWPRAVQMVRDGHRDGLVGAYGLDGLRVGSEPIGWVGLAFYTRHDSDWRYSGDASLLGQRLGLAQGYVNNPRFEAWRSRPATTTCTCRSSAASACCRATCRNCCSAASTCYWKTATSSSTTWSIIRSSPDRSAALANCPGGSRCTSASVRTCRRSTRVSRNSTKGCANCVAKAP